MKAPSFRVRLAAYHTAAVACFLGLAGLGGHWTLERIALGQLDAALLALAETEAVALRTGAEPPRQVHEFAPGTAPPSFARLDRLVQVVDLDGTVLARSANLGTARLPVPALMLQRLREGEVVFGTFHDFGEEPIRLAALPINSGGKTYAVQVAGSLDDAYALVRAGRWLFAGLSGVLILAVAFTSAFFARRALRPVDEIVDRARRIDEASLDERLPHPGRSDELGRLVETLNAMLDRVERGVEAQRRFTTDASHELRSPLSRLRAELEVTLRRPRENAEYQEALKSCLEEVEGLTQLTEELLTLAHLDAEREAEIANPVALLPILDEAVRRLGPQAARRAVRVLVEPGERGLAVRASAAVVRLALTNVLDNAVKFSPTGGDVRVGVTASGADAVIVVSDSGPGVESDELPHLFGRFHRGAASRAGDAPGFGLGLAISRAALERQGGQIDADRNPESGARFSIRLPMGG